MFYFIFFQREISEMRRLISAKFCTVVSTRPNFLFSVQNFVGPTPKSFRGQKHAKFGLKKIWSTFGLLRSSAADISGTDEGIQNRINILSTVIPPTSGETSLVSFGLVQLTPLTCRTLALQADLHVSGACI